MTFGQKLKALLKEKGMTQENLAELLDVSRQAASKWVNDKGIPEVDKLIQISNIFGVTLDYLLKEDQEEEGKQSGGYYVSREMIDGFLSYKQQSARRIAAGVSLIILANLPDCFLSYEKVSAILYYTILAAGISILIWNGLKPKRYREIGSKQLLFDDSVIREVHKQNEKNRKKYALMFIAGTAFLLASGGAVGFAVDYFGYHLGAAIDWILTTVWVDLFILAGIGFYSENLLIKGTPKQGKGGKYAWIYGALPVTAFLVMIGYVTNAWSPVMPILVLLCILLVTVCRLIVEGRMKG